MQYTVFVCGNSIGNVARIKTLTLRPDVLQQHCSNTIEAKQVSILWHVETDNPGKPDYSVKVDFVLQELGGLVMLPEGVSYSMMGKSRVGIIKTFGFSLVNKIETKVFVRQLKGNFKSFAKIVKDEDRLT